MNSFIISSRRAKSILLLAVFLIFFSGAFSQKQIFYIHDRDTRIQSAKLYGADIKDVVIARLDGAFDVEVDPDNDLIYWSEPGKLLSYDMGTKQIKLLRNYEPEGAFTTNITAVALDRVNGKIYWINAGDGKIERANPDGSDFEEVFSSSAHISSTFSMSVDPDNQKIYWSGIEYIRRVSYDGSEPENIITDDIFQPEGIFIDQKNDLIYWADLVGNVIKRANLDGSNAEDVYSVELENPADVVLNNEGTKLYVLDRGSFGDAGIIIEVNLDGSDKTEIINDLDDPVAITIDDSAKKLYWLDNSNSVIMETAGIDGSNRDTLILELSSFKNLEISGPDEKIFWVSSGDIYIADLNGGNIRKFIETANASVIDIIVDAENRMLYWTESGAIRRINTDGTQQQDLVTTDVDDPNYLTLDPDAGKMYWVNGGFDSDRIKWANLDGSENIDLITGLDQPLDLSFNSRAGKIYWREGGFFVTILKRSNRDGSGIETVIEDGSGIQSYYVSEKSDLMFWSARDIFSAAADGSDATEIVNEDWQTYSLTADPGAEKIYWFTVDNDQHVIKRSNYDGSSVERIIEGLPSSFIDRKLILYGDGITGTDQQVTISSDFRFDLYPNPTNDNSTLTFQMPDKARVNISLFDLSGQKVNTIINEIRQKGDHSIVFSRNKLTAGVYFIRGQTNGSLNVVKLIILD